MFVYSQEKYFSSGGRVVRSLCYFSDFKAARTSLRLELPGVSRGGNSHWEKPPISVVKLNCDASMKGNRFVGIEFVLRDNSGKVLGAEINRVQENLEVEYAKAVR